MGRVATGGGGSGEVGVRLDDGDRDAEERAQAPLARRQAALDTLAQQKDIDLEVSSSPRASAFKRIFCAKAPKCVIA